MPARWWATLALTVRIYSHRRVCSYDPRASAAGSATSHTSSTTALDYAQEPDNPFPAVFFLDSALFHRSVNSLPDSTFTLDPDIQAFVGNVFEDKAFVSSYFTFTHPWIPFLSKKLFMERVLNPLAAPKSSSTLFVAAMKLLATPPCNGDARKPVYHMIKAALLRAEKSNVLHFRIFQVMIFVALYELGHAIYPAAYLTIGSCLRYGSAMGINNTVETRDHPESQSHIEAEERRRTWWAAILLDRFMNLGCAERACLFRDPSSNSILPMDDGLWEQGGDIDFRGHLLSSPPTETMGRYCLTAQAAVLLGRVFRNIHDDPDIEGFHENEARALESTLVALTNVSLQEGRFRGIGVCSPTTVCFSARLLLHDEERYPKHNFTNIADHFALQNIEGEIAAHMLRLASSLSATGRCGAEETSPFCMDAMYRSGIVYARRYKEAQLQEDLHAFETIKAGLKVISGRWKAADSYVGMLAAREITGIL
ncbi:ATP-dependent Clp protease proteolytic subunit [Fusarium albosuccineum]|uniref:ATP-dependent Clp protease proteolytic subunit n=1 Tax=Fusarium albosuccineum TaxID=1237068 RepID=A0A8H4L315_9HYPO|nr:ATP-dependent Clp protease proteolytic subunit [Fusarium albosuccineum]